MHRRKSSSLLIYYVCYKINFCLYDLKFNAVQVILEKFFSWFPITHLCKTKNTMYYLL